MVRSTGGRRRLGYRRGMPTDFRILLWLLKLGALVNLYFLASTLALPWGAVDPHVVVPAQILFVVSGYRCLFPNRYEGSVDPLGVVVGKGGGGPHPAPRVWNPPPRSGRPAPIGASIGVYRQPSPATVLPVG